MTQAMPLGKTEIKINHRDIENTKKKTTRFHASEARHSPINTRKEKKSCENLCNRVVKNPVNPIKKDYVRNK